MALSDSIAGLEAVFAGLGRETTVTSEEVQALVRLLGFWRIEARNMEERFEALCGRQHRAVFEGRNVVTLLPKTLSPRDVA